MANQHFLPFRSAPVAKDIAVCPFNKSHVLPSSSLQKHIIKCMVRYPNHKTCPYNALHRFVNEEDFVKHIMECPNKTIGWVKMNYPVHGDLTERSVQPNNIHQFNFEYENWDT